MENKKILITGGAGFIGSNLALALQEKYPENQYFIIDNFSSGNQNNLEGFRGEIITGDIAKIDLKKYFPDGLDIIFHQAAITDTTVTDKDKMLSANVQGFRNVLDFAMACRARLIYASSAAVYGQSKPPMRVGENEIPTNLYGASKLNADNLARKYFETYKDNKIIGLRYFNVYGPREKYKEKMASMIWQLYLQMKDGKRPRIFKHGEQKRDQVYIKDVVKANILAMDCQESGIFNVATGKATSFNQIVEGLNEPLGTKLEPDYFENPYGFYQDFTEADLSKTKEALDYEPEYDIKAGIKDYLSFEQTKI